MLRSIDAEASQGTQSLQLPRWLVDSVRTIHSTLRQVVDILRDCEHSEFSVDRSLRPLLVPIVTARLGRRGIDMALAPRRSQELLGDRLWEIVRPDRASAANRVGRGLAGDDLREAIERLEQL